MKKPTNQLNKFSPIILITAVSITVIIITFFLSAGKNGRGLLPSKNTETQPVTENLPVIQNASDLNNLDSELTNTDLDQFDRQLDQLEKDFSTF